MEHLVRVPIIQSLFTEFNSVLGVVFFNITQFRLTNITLYIDGTVHNDNNDVFHS